MGIRVREIESWPAREIEEYIAQYNIEPFGEDRADIRAAYAAAVTYNLGRQSKKIPARKPKDFMPQWSAPRAQSADHIKNVLTMFAKAHNAKVKPDG